MLYKRSAELLEAEVGEDLVALNPQAGDCFGFNQVAKQVWRSLEEPKSFERLRDELLSEYDVSPEQCSVELQSLLDDMVSQGLAVKVTD
jgi:hypothetical protein